MFTQFSIRKNNEYLFYRWWWMLSETSVSFFILFYLRWIWALTAFQSNSNKMFLLQVWLGQEKMNEWMKSNKTQTTRREWERERERGREIIRLSNVRKENIHNELHKSLSTTIENKLLYLFDKSLCVIGTTEQV